MSFQMFPCPHCPAEFDSHKSLEHHLKTAHDEVADSHKFRCVTCDEEFMSHMDWLSHQEEHGDEREPSGEAVA
jgi:hypothetical protein